MASNASISLEGKLKNTEREPFGMIAKQSLMIGAGSVPPALVLGSVLGAFRSAHPTAFALAFTMQWFTFSSTFWVTRSLLIHPPTYTLQPLSLEHYPKAASTVSASIAGALVGLLARGKRSIVPGALTFSVLGYLGHTAFSAFEVKHIFVEKTRSGDQGLGDSARDVGSSNRDQAGQNILQRFAKSKWSPMTEMSNEEHRRILVRRREEIEDEISAINGEIEKLKEKAKQEQRSPERRA